MKLEFNPDAKRLYETGARDCVLFTKNASTTEHHGYAVGVAWNGFTGLTESPSGAEATALYSNDGKYLDLMSAEELGGTITAYTYPDEYAACDGSEEIAPGVVVSQQDRIPFALCYKTVVGNDVEKNKYGYKLHIIYGCMASPSEKEFNSINDSPEAVEFSWEFSTTPIEFKIKDKTYKSSKVEIDSTKFKDEAAKAKLQKIIDAFYGTADTEPNLLYPDELAKLCEDAAG